MYISFIFHHVCPWTSGNLPKPYKKADIETISDQRRKNDHRQHTSSTWISFIHSFSLITLSLSWWIWSISREQWHKAGIHSGWDTPTCMSTLINVIFLSVCLIGNVSHLSFPSLGFYDLYISLGWAYTSQ